MSFPNSESATPGVVTAAAKTSKNRALVVRTCRSRHSASAIERRSAMLMSSLPLASKRDRSSICTNRDALNTRRAVKPCRNAFFLARAFPAIVRGPVLLLAFPWFAARWRWMSYESYATVRFGISRRRTFPASSSVISLIVLRKMAA